MTDEQRIEKAAKEYIYINDDGTIDDGSYAFKGGIIWRDNNPNKKVIDVIQYCKPHTDKMWAATIVGLLLDCDFKDSKHAITEFEKSLK